MRINHTTATTSTTATAVAFAYTATVADHASSMWSSPAFMHVNKRRAGQPHGVLN